MINKGYIEEVLISELAIFANENNTIMDLMTLYQEANIINIEKNTEIYKENIKAYKEYLSIVSQIIRKIAIKDNPISISLIIDKLLYSGYFSKNSKYDIQLTSSCPNITGYLGLNIINGEGCCRHEASFHEDIFSNLNLPNFTIVGYYDLVITLETIFQSIGNHVINIIEFENAYYCHNHFYNQLGYFQNAFKMKAYGLKFINSFFYKPSMDMYWNLLKHKELIDRLILFDEDSKKAHLEEEKINLIRKESELRYLESSSLKAEIKSVTKEYAKKIIPKASL